MSKRERGRLSKGKKIKPAFFIFCEGETEKLYVEHLRAKYRVPIDAQVVGNKIRERYIRNYKKSRVTHPKDKYFLLYDVDAPRMLEKLQAIHNVVLLVSNPCVELWFLLHFKEQRGGIDCNACEKELRKHHAGYVKGKLSLKFRQDLDEKQDRAVERARKLNHPDNPSSTIYLLIEELERIKGV